MSQPVLPGGDVTFLFTDIEDSQWALAAPSGVDVGGAGAPSSSPTRDDRRHRGQVFQVVGDAFCAAFGSAGDAVAAALAAQRALQAGPWGETGPLRVRIGIHTGSAEPLEGDYPSSLTLIRAQQGTLSLLHYVLRRSRQERLLVIATYREVELDRVHPLAAALVDWHRERLAARLTLHRLSQDETGALLATLFGEARVAADLTRVTTRARPRPWRDEPEARGRDGPSSTGTSSPTRWTSSSSGSCALKGARARPPGKGRPAPFPRATPPRRNQRREDLPG